MATVEERADALAYAATVLGEAEAVERIFAAYGEVTPEEVRRAAATWLTEERAATLVVVPGADAGDGRARTARLVAGTVVTTAAAGVLFHELRRRGGLADVVRAGVGAGVLVALGVVHGVPPVAVVVTCPHQTSAPCPFPMTSP